MPTLIGSALERVGVSRRKIRSNLTITVSPFEIVRHPSAEYPKCDKDYSAPFDNSPDDAAEQHPAEKEGNNSNSNACP
jgi:hypothetical protein